MSVVRLQVGRKVVMVDCDHQKDGACASCWRLVELDHLERLADLLLEDLYRKAAYVAQLNRAIRGISA